VKKFWPILVVVAVVLITAGVYFWPKRWLSPKGSVKQVAELNLLKYDFDSLKERGGVVGEITIGGAIPAIETRRKLAHSGGQAFTTREISFTSEGKKISGMINYYLADSFAVKAGRPVIIMIRGYADKPGYYPGYGTWRVADKLAEVGYTTISLDFLGFADSESESPDMMAARFEKVNAVLDLIESVKQLPWVDKDRIGIWAHSNGGQIALSVLEVTGGKYPTVLWAPMTNPFPQSVLDTADSLDDGGVAVRTALAEFEKHYDARRYAFENYYQWINAPILIQQGTADDQVQVKWQESVVAGLKKLGKKVSLIIYQGDDHNMSKDWGEAVGEDLKFFLAHLVVN
jgi:dipeptidyl aminopeptidase/acylaminoacyl peptidase